MKLNKIIAFALVFICLFVSKSYAGIDWEIVSYECNGNGTYDVTISLTGADPLNPNTGTELFAGYGLNSPDGFQIDTACYDPSLITGANCPFVFAPVCACNGVLYGNSCVANESGYTALFDGDCFGTEVVEFIIRNVPIAAGPDIVIWGKYFPDPSAQFFLQVITLPATNPCQVLGCLDPSAHNFNPLANIDDGSCETCSDGELNGDEVGIDCGGNLCMPCVMELPGCTDSNATNYNPDATQDDGSCAFCCNGMQDGNETGVDCGGPVCKPCSYTLDCSHIDTFIINDIPAQITVDQVTGKFGLCNMSFAKDFSLQEFNVDCSFFDEKEFTKDSIWVYDLTTMDSCLSFFYLKKQGVCDCNNPEVGPLLSFYKSTRGPGWSNKEGWERAALGLECDPCNNSQTGSPWYGIGCDPTGTRVVQIELINNRLRGFIKLLPMLTELNDINLSENNLLGGNWGFLNGKLEVINISSNPNLSTPIPNFNLPQLRQLYCYGNALEGPLPPFNQTPQLTDVFAFNNKVNGPIPNYELPNLVNLSLAINELSGPLPDLSQSPQLFTLFLDENNLTGTLLDYANNTLLDTFIVANNNLEGCMPPNRYCTIGRFDAIGNSLLAFQGDYSQICPPNNLPQEGAPCGISGDSVIVNCVCTLIPCDPSSLPKIVFNGNQTSCNGEALNISLITSDGGQDSIIVEAIDNPNIQGETNAVYTTGNGVIMDVLTNNSTFGEVGHYIAYVTRDGCRGDTTDIFIDLYSSVVVDAQDFTICEDSCVIMNVSMTGGTGVPVNYNWSNGAITPDPIFCPDFTTTYEVTVTDDFGCTGSGQSEVIVEPCEAPFICPMEVDSILCQPWVTQIIENTTFPCSQIGGNDIYYEVFTVQYNGSTHIIIHSFVQSINPPLTNAVYELYTCDGDQVAFCNYLGFNPTCTDVNNHPIIGDLIGVSTKIYDCRTDELNCNDPTCNGTFTMEWPNVVCSQIWSLPVQTSGGMAPYNIEVFLDGTLNNTITDGDGSDTLTFFFGDHNSAISLSITDASGCTDFVDNSSTQNIGTASEIEVDITLLSDTICQGDDLSMSLSFSGGIPPYDFSLIGLEDDYPFDNIVDNPYSLMIPNLPDPVGQSSLFVRGTDGNGCPTSDFFIPTELVIKNCLPCPADEVFTSTAICPDSLASLTAADFANEDPNGDGMLGWKGAEPFVFGPNTYTVVVDANCSYTQMVTIEELPLDQCLPCPVDETFAPITICFDSLDNVTLTTFANEDPNGDGMLGWKGAEPFVFGPNTYTVVVDANCSYTQMVTIEELPLDQCRPCPADETFTPITVCFDSLDNVTLATFADEDPNGDDVFGWQIPTTFVFGQNDVNVVDSNGCSYTQSVEILEELEANCTVVDSCEFTLGDDQISITENGSYTVNVIENDDIPFEFTWMVLSVTDPELLDSLKINESNGTVSFESNQAFFDPIEIVYEVCAEDCSECKEAALTVTNSTFEDIVPTTLFSPNDDGIDDVLRFSNEDEIEDSELWIYNRWGNQIYHKENYTNDWEGKGYPGGVYFYVLEVRGVVLKRQLTIVK